MANGNGNMTLEQAMKRIAELEAEKKGKITIKMAEFGSGTVSVYGLQRFPVSLHGPTWEKLLSVADDIKAFIAANGDEIRCKSYAAEALKKLNIKWDESSNATNETYKTRYAEFYMQAKKDAKLVPAR